MSREHRAHANLRIASITSIRPRYHVWVGEHSHVRHQGNNSPGKCLLHLTQFRQTMEGGYCFTDRSKLGEKDEERSATQRCTHQEREGVR